MICHVLQTCVNTLCVLLAGHSGLVVSEEHGGGDGEEVDIYGVQHHH